MIEYMENITLKINGMHCSGCSQRLQKVLKNTDGIEDAFVSLDTRDAKINFDSSNISLKEICDVILDAGFEVEC